MSETSKENRRSEKEVRLIEEKENMGFYIVWCYSQSGFYQTCYIVDTL